MLKSVTLLIALFAIISIPVSAQVRITGKSGASIESLIQDKTMVTIVLKGNNHDVNLRLTGVSDTLVNFKTIDGTKNVYALSTIQEIRVQKSQYAVNDVSKDRIPLTRSEQAILDRAITRTEELFNTLKATSNKPQSLTAGSNEKFIKEFNQQLTMNAALLLAASGKKQYQTYLEDIMNGDDIDRAITAATYLMQINVDIPNEIIREAFLNGTRLTRSRAARIVGLTGKKEFLRDLRKMSMNSHPEIYPSSIRALGLLGDRDSLPQMYVGLKTLSQAKVEAAIFALSKIGGDDVIAKLNSQYAHSKNIEKARILRLLYILGDDNAANSMRDIGLNNLAYNKAAALILTENSDWDGINWIRQYLAKAKDPNMSNLFYRGYAAEALFETAPNESMKILQELMRITPTEIYAKGYNKDEAYKKNTALYIHANSCSIIGRLADKSMLTLLSTMMHEESTLVSLVACEAIILTTDPDLRDWVNRDYEFQGAREQALKDFFK